MILRTLQVIVSVLIVALILLQERSSGLSAIFGGEGGAYQTRRGLEKSAFIATIILSAAFVVLAILQLVL